MASPDDCIVMTHRLFKIFTAMKAINCLHEPMCHESKNNSLPSLKRLVSCSIFYLYRLRDLTYVMCYARVSKQYKYCLSQNACFHTTSVT